MELAPARREDTEMKLARKEEISSEPDRLLHLAYLAYWKDLLAYLKYRNDNYLAWL